MPALLPTDNAPTYVNYRDSFLAVQGPLASYFPGIAYDVATNAFQATTTAQLTPMYEAILQAAPSDAAGAVAWLEQWEPILEVVLGNFGVSANQGALVYGFRFANLVAAYEAVGLPVGIVAAASALGIPSAEIVAGGSVSVGSRRLNMGAHTRQYRHRRPGRKPRGGRAGAYPSKYRHRKNTIECDGTGFYIGGLLAIPRIAMQFAIE